MNRDAARRKHLSNMAWQVRFRKGRASGEKPCVLVLVEFSPTCIGAWPSACASAWRCCWLGWPKAAHRGRRVGCPGCCQSWSITANGSEPWTAVGQESGLTPLPSEQARADLALLQPQAYRLWAGWSLDFRGAVSGGLALGQPGLGHGAAANGGDAAGFAAAAFGVIGPLSRAGERSVSMGAAHLAWALWEYKTVSGVGFPTFEELERTKGAVMTTAAEAAWDRWKTKVRAEGIEQGVERGVRLERMNEAAQRCAEIVGSGLSSLDHGDILHDERGLPK